MNRAQRRQEKQKTKKQKERKALIKKREQERMEPETRWDVIKHWVIIAAFILAPLFLTIYSFNQKIEKVDLTRFDIQLSENIEVKKSFHRSSSRSYNQIIIWDHNYVKPFQVPYYRKEVIHKRELENLPVNSFLTIEIDREELQNVNEETFWNNWTKVYSISHQGKFLLKNYPQTEPQKGSYKFLFLSLFGLSFIPYEFIKDPWINIKFGFFLGAVFSIIPLFFF